MSVGMWQKYNATKLLTSIKSTNEPLNSFSFPSVTVCSQNRFSKTKLSRLRTQYTQLHQLTDYEIELILRIVIKPDSSSYYIDELKAIQKILDVNGVTIAQLINFTEQVQV